MEGIDVIIRVMKIGDYDIVCDVWKDHNGINHFNESMEGFTNYLKRNPTTSFVAEDNGKIVGTILAGHDGRRGFFHHVVVLPEYRNQGIGRKIVGHAMEALEKEGINKVALVVFQNNQLGNAFWEKLEFTVREDLIYRNKFIAEMIRIDT